MYQMRMARAASLRRGKDQKAVRAERVRFVAERMASASLENFDSSTQIELLAMARSAIAACDAWSEAN